MVKKILLLITSINICIESFAQDPQSSLFNATPLYHNPAFAGSTAFSRFSMSHRSQWISLGSFAAYNTQMASFDTYCEKLRSGFGASVINDTQGAGFHSFSGSFAYSFNLINAEKNGRLHQVWLGAEANYKRRWISDEDMTFVYQYNSNGFDGSIPSPALNSSLFRSSLIDFGSGIIYATRSTHNINEPAFIAGFSMQHMGQSGFKNTKMTFHFSKTIPLTHEKGSDENSLVFTTYYRRMSGNQQIDVGINRIKGSFMYGAWYRGMPFLKNNGIIQSDAVYPMIGLQSDKLRVTLAYDIPITALRSSGSFEISVGYVFARGFDFKTHTSDDRTRCTQYGYYWLF